VPAIRGRRHADRRQEHAREGCGNEVLHRENLLAGPGLRTGERRWPGSVDTAPAGFSRGYDADDVGWKGNQVGDGFIAIYIFMLAAIAGHVIISRVPVILHTPLMSGSNFIHGIVLIGAMVVLGHADTPLEKAIGFVAVLLGAGNAAGGYVVTERMLDMFKASKKPGSKRDDAKAHGAGA
jgi:NAD(P) transhydrogenase subunit alpha